ncbi:hypothetical protein KDA_66110 [Dictyobacter alpinus]|uniref:Uncharacterized protein n=1 Tax=Dictyobacter alpinus TaxID=2014873 RepID=A0A402BIP3_9CHLR|nr:hypothetical protein [Dictyobacter alpinus]GCE31127.1 hypothetical protein KDA_66110 [Dictyobacter alpinus]
MNKRLSIITLIIMLVIGGLIAGIYSGPIQKALTPAMTNAMGNNKAPQPPAMQPNKPGANQPGQAKTPNAGGMPNQMNPNQANVLAQDTFQRTNQPFWGQSSDGRKWEGDANTSKVFSITGATGLISHGQGTANAVLGTATDNVDVLANGSINQFGNGVNLGVVLRWTNGQNWYKALIDGQHLSILKRVNGTSTQVRSVGFDAQNDKLYSIRFRAIGAMLFAKVWRSNSPEPNNWQISISDPELKTGQAGLRVVVQPTTVISITSFIVTPANMGNDL